jgi:drug/metabolite transporter (DMT)-like permease
MVAVAAASFAGVWAKRHTADYEPLGLTGVQFVVGTAVLIVALVVMEGMPVAITAAGWSLIVYMAVFATFMPFLLFYWLLLRVTAVQASLVGYLVPIVAVVAGIVFLDEQLQPGLALGGTLILAGVLLTDRLENRPRP